MDQWKDAHFGKSFRNATNYHGKLRNHFRRFKQAALMPWGSPELNALP